MKKVHLKKKIKLYLFFAALTRCAAYLLDSL